MSKGLEELKRLAYENACCRCQYYIDKKCTNNGECVWKTIEKELKALEVISQNFRLMGNCLHARNPYAKDGWVFIKELETEEELNAWKEVLVCH